MENNLIWMWRKYLVGVCLPFLVVVLMVGCSGSSGTVDREVDFNLSASELMSDYQLDEGEADGKYLDKVIEVMGVLQSVQKLKNGRIQLSLKTGEEIGSVLCNLEKGKESAIASLKVNSPIRVKGICMGMLMDVLLESSVVVN
ncbi:MAG: hypothetical protein AAF990_03495 [Bacteroidota bacterium]